MVKAFEKLETNVRILKKHVEEKQQSKMEETKDANLFEPFDEKSSKFEIVEMKKNMWNSADCGKKLRIMTIHKERVNVYSGFDDENYYNCVRAEYPIPKFNLAAKKQSIVYFEVKLGDWHSCPNCDANYQIGFCTQKFPLEHGDLGHGENSIGICDKEGIWIDGSYIKFENNNRHGHLHAGDTIGLGIIRSPADASLKCFVTLPGERMGFPTIHNEFIGIVELPAKFANLQIFPAVNLGSDAKIETNFGLKEWQFNFNKLP